MLQRQAMNTKLTPDKPALILAAVLNSSICLAFVNSLVFLDSKRPLTKRVLQRLDLSALWSRIDRREVALGANARLTALGLSAISQESVNAFEWPNSGSSQQ